MSSIALEFKPCPFCGREGIIVDSCTDGAFAARCQCGAMGPGKKSKAEAITIWNTREQDMLWNPFHLSARSPDDEFNADFKGNLGTLDFATVLQMLASEDKSGILHVARPHTKSVICLKNGDIIAASDSGGLRLGQLLYHNRMISRKRLYDALRIAQKNNKMIGEVLLTMGYVTRDALKKVIHQQVQKVVLEIFFWREGYFEYKDCMIKFDEHITQSINTMEIIMESVRRIDEWNERKRKKNLIAEKKLLPLPEHE
ncbi:Lar family restriction alleviation protein [Desulfococcaceae bacterium HSG8]|nr:Lar family restriction alleviation protein [Desulfococcaceae bacterium HSG8]